MGPVAVGVASRHAPRRRLRTDRVVGIEAPGASRGTAGEALSRYLSCERREHKYTSMDARQSCLQPCAPRPVPHMDDVRVMAPWRCSRLGRQIGQCPRAQLSPPDMDCLVPCRKCIDAECRAEGCGCIDDQRSMHRPRLASPRRCMSSAACACGRRGPGAKPRRRQPPAKSVDHASATPDVGGKATDMDTRL